MEAQKVKEMMDDTKEFQLNNLIDTKQGDELREFLEELDELGERGEFIERLQDEEFSQFEMGLIFGFNLGIEKGKVSAYKMMLQDAGVDPDKMELKNADLTEAEEE